MSVPRISASTPETTSRRRVTRKPAQNSGSSEISCSIVASSRVMSGRAQGCGCPGRRRRPARASDRSVAVDCGRLDERQDRSGRGVPRGFVAAVLVRGFQHVVDPVAELGVLQREADAVGLLGEGLADDLELALVLGRQAREDDVVGRDGDDGAVAQRLRGSCCRCRSAAPQPRAPRGWRPASSR